MVVNFLTGSKLLGANTYAEDEILMPQTKKGQLPGLLALEIENKNNLDAAGDFIEAHLSIKSQDDTLELSDPDCICKIRLESDGVSVDAEHNKIVRYTFDGPVPISYTKIYIGLKSTEAQTVHYRLVWTGVSSFTPQRDNIITQQQF